MKNILVTGFGSFGTIDTNPSAWLAEHSGVPYEILEVSYLAADAFLAEVAEREFDAWLMMGVSPLATELRLEFLAKNQIGKNPDVRGWIPSGVIDPSGDPQISSNLWKIEWINEERGVLPSQDAGAFLCNYLLYQGLRLFPEKEIGFLHVPRFEVIPAAEQLVMVQELIAKIAEQDCLTHG